MLIEFVGHNDAAVSVKPEQVRMVTAGTTLGTANIYFAGVGEPVVVQGFRDDVASRLKAHRGEAPERSRAAPLARAFAGR